MRLGKHVQEELSFEVTWGGWTKACVHRCVQEGKEDSWWAGFSHSLPVTCSKGSWLRPQSQHEEEDQHNQQDCKEHSNGTPLAPIAGHVRHLGKLLHHIVQTRLSALQLM